MTIFTIFNTNTTSILCKEKFSKKHQLLKVHFPETTQY